MVKQRVIFKDCANFHLIFYNCFSCLLHYQTMILSQADVPTCKTSFSKHHGTSASALYKTRMKNKTNDITFTIECVCSLKEKIATVHTKLL